MRQLGLEDLLQQLERVSDDIVIAMGKKMKRDLDHVKERVEERTKGEENHGHYQRCRLTSPSCYRRCHRSNVRFTTHEHYS